MTPAGACGECLARAWLLARLAPHLDVVRHRVPAVLDLGKKRAPVRMVGNEPACASTMCGRMMFLRFSGISQSSALHDEQRQLHIKAHRP